MSPLLWLYAMTHASAVVPPSPDPPKIRFEPHGAFTAELRARTDAYFDGADGPRRSRRDMPAMYLKAFVILGWFAASWALLVFGATTFWQATALAISLGLSIAGIGMCVQHDANHGAFSSHGSVNAVFRFSLDIMGVHSFIWRQKHNVLHHTYTNIEGVDFDLDFGFIARLSPEQERRPWHRYQHLYLWILYGFLLPKWVLIDDFSHLRTKRLGPHHMPSMSRGELCTFAAGKLIFLGWAVVIPSIFHPAWQVALFLFLAVFTLGVTLSSVFQLAHCVGEAEFFRGDGDGDDAPIAREFAAHQVATTVDFARDSALVTWFLGGLNYQVEHHLFPKVCHLHYPALSSIVEEVAKKHGIRYRANLSLGEALASHFRLLRTLGRPVAAA